MSTIFSKIIAKEIPADIVYEDDLVWEEFVENKHEWMNFIGIEELLDKKLHKL